MVSTFLYRRQEAAADSARFEEMGLILDALSRSQAMIEFKPDGTIITANQCFCDAMGYRLEDIVGKHHRMFCDPAYTQTEEYRQFWAELTSNDFKTGQYERIANGGRRIFLQATYNPIRDRDGRVVKIIKLASDVTKRVENVDCLAAALQALADGDLAYRIDQPFLPDMARLRDDFNSALPKLEEAIAAVKGSAGEMASGMQEISEAALDLSKRTETQAASLEETTAALAEITTTVKSSAATVVETRKLAGSAKVEAEKSGEVVGRAIEAMNGISEASKEINHIIAVIDEIAFQTNLLALNAGVEAARAGEAGRGFAVVASEVRALAQRSADAAKQIKTLISSSTAQVGKGVELVGETGSALERIVTCVADINASINEIATSAEEQATAISELNSAVGDMDSVTQQNAAMVEQTTAATRTLAERTDELTRLVSVFQTSQDSQVRELRSALKSATANQPSQYLSGAGRPRAAGAAVRKQARAGSAAVSTDLDWEEF